MSVLKAHRGVSSMEYVKVADTINHEVLLFLTRLSARFDRLLSPKTIALADDLADFAMMANDIGAPNDRTKYDLREKYLLQAKAANAALDRRLRRVYEVLMLNPQGCFTRSNGKTVPKGKAVELLDNMCEELGCLIDREDALLDGVLASDLKKWGIVVLKDEQDKRAKEKD